MSTTIVEKIYNINMKFSEILRLLRKEHKLTYEQLSQKIGYSKAIIGFWENDQKQPTLSALIALANFFNVSIDYLAGREDEYGYKLNQDNTYDFEYTQTKTTIKSKNNTKR